MKSIKLFEEFNDNTEIDDICKRYNIRNYSINSDGTIDVDGNVYLDKKRLTKLPLKFNKVTGVFLIYNNKLTSLEGCPKEVGDNFHCGNNKLTSLEGGPISVGSDYWCPINNLTSFEGSPISVGGDFECNNNPVSILWDLFDDFKHLELFNDLDIIREDNIIILQRLNEFLDMIGKPKVTSVEGYKCI